MTTERDMLDLLHQRYTNIRQGTIADRYTRADHVANTCDWRQRRRIADFIVADKYGSKDVSLHGFEIKVTRSDWLNELRDPTKADAFKRYMHHWWLVIPDKTIVRAGELPPDWGLLVATQAWNGTYTGLRARTAAPRLTPEPLPLDLTMNLMTAAARTAWREPLHRDAPDGHLDRAGRWTRSCTFCGEPAPCHLHQPRAIARNTLPAPEVGI